MKKIKHDLFNFINKNKKGVCGSIAMGMSNMYVYAATSLPAALSGLNKLKSLLIAVAGTFGVYLLVFGIMETSKAYGNHDASGVSNGAGRIVGGVLCCAVAGIISYLGF